MTALRPPRLLLRLLRAVSSRDAANSAVGDIAEEFHELAAAGRAPARTQLWLTGRLLTSISAAASFVLPSVLRTAALVVRDAWRSVRRSPAHSLFVMAILALGISVGTATFSVVDAVMLKPLPLDHPEELVSIYSTNFPVKPYKNMTPSSYFDFRDRTNSLESVASISTTTGGTATVDGVTDFLAVTRTSADIFKVLRLTTELGRLWTSEEEARGEATGAVLGYAFWKQRFGADPSVLGKTVVVGRGTYRVIGVLSAATDTPEYPLLTTPIWLPTVLSRNSPPESRVGGIYARMRAGVTPDNVADEVQRLAALDWRPNVVRLREGAVTQVRSWMLLALGAAMLVVLIACVNAANLLLARASQRSQEIAIRSSLGASRRRVGVSVLVEGLLLSVGATAVALAGSVWSIAAARTVMTTMVRGVFRASAISLNGRVFAAAIIAAIVTGLLFAVVPAWQMSKASVVELLKDGGPNATRGSSWRGGFLIAEIASVSVLVVVAWMFVGSLVKAISIDVGIDGTHLLAVNPRVEFKATVDEVKALVSNVPGVSDVAVTLGAGLPLFSRASSGAWVTTTVAVDGEVGASTELLDYRVTPNYFKVAGIQFRQGGVWPADVDTAADVPVVIDEQAARQLFGDRNPIGLSVTSSTQSLPGTHRVVGVVASVRVLGPEEDIKLPAAVFFPLKPAPARNFASLLVRTTTAPDPLVPVITKALEAFAPVQPEGYVFTASEAMRRITINRRFNAALMSVFGVAGLVIGAAGIFAMMAAAVAQRTREIGVRVALGATPRMIRREVLTAATRHVVVGLAIGLPIAWWLSRGFAALLFHVTPTDVSVYVGVAALMIVVGVLAGLVPARRASRVDPIVSLRS